MKKDLSVIVELDDHCPVDYLKLMMSMVTYLTEIIRLRWILLERRKRANGETKRKRSHIVSILFLYPFGHSSKILSFPRHICHTIVLFSSMFILSFLLVHLGRFFSVSLPSFSRLRFASGLFSSRIPLWLCMYRRWMRWFFRLSFFFFFFSFDRFRVDMLMKAKSSKNSTKTKTKGKKKKKSHNCRICDEKTFLIIYL